jgi:hypothetical protein
MNTGLARNLQYKGRPKGGPERSRKGKRMDTRNGHFNFSGERISALLLAIAATVMVFAAINAGFAPLAVHAAGGTLGA